MSGGQISMNHPKHIYQISTAINIIISLVEFLDNYDYGILLGYRYKLSDKMNLYGRIQVGFKSIFKPDFDNIDYEMYQVRLNIGASYRIF